MFSSPNFFSLRHWTAVRWTPRLDSTAIENVDNIEKIKGCARERNFARWFWKLLTFLVVLFKSEKTKLRHMWATYSRFLAFAILLFLSSPPAMLNRRQAHSAQFLDCLRRWKSLTGDFRINLQRRKWNNVIRFKRKSTTFFTFLFFPLSLRWTARTWSFSLIVLVVSGG